MDKLVLWSGELYHSTLNAFVFVNTLHQLAGFFQNESIWWLLHLLHSVKQSPAGKPGK